jgi:hypothetical protein
MDRLTLDTDTYNRVTTYVFEGVDERRLSLIGRYLPTKWNVPKLSEEEGKWKKVSVSMNYKLQRKKSGAITLVVPEDMDSIVDEAIKKLQIDEGCVNHPLNPKYERMMELMKGYFQQGGKQLVFTEEKIHHRKLKRIISRGLGIHPDRVGIINAEEAAGYRLEKTIKEYNFGDVDVVIANRKAELGVNLQVGTTAIHHLTLPWTPASIQQRNGRGIRQGNEEAQVMVHYYFGERTFDFYRHTILEMKANWINELLESDKQSIPNSEAPDIEEILDLLSDSPEEAEKRRSERQRMALEFYTTKQKQGLFNMLRAMTVTAAKSHRDIRRFTKIVERINEEYAHECRAMEEQEELCRREQAETEKRIQEARLQNPKHQTKEDITLLLNDFRDQHLDKMELFANDIEDLTRKLSSFDRYDKEFLTVRHKLLETKVAKEMLEREYIKKVSKLHEKVREMGPYAEKKYYYDPNWRKKLKKQTGIVLGELTRRIDELRVKDDKYFNQNVDYFKEMDKAGKLPFDISIVDSLGKFIMSADNRFVYIGEKYLFKQAKTFNTYDVVEIYPEEKTVKAIVYDPLLGKKSKSVALDALLKYEKISDEQHASLGMVVYGKLPESEIYTSHNFNKCSLLLKFDLKRGLVTQKSGEFHVHFDESIPVGRGMTPVWPDPKSKVFCREVCKAWLKYKDTENASSALMEDLFGEDFEEVVKTYAGKSQESKDSMRTASA